MEFRYAFLMVSSIVKLSYMIEQFFEAITWKVLLSKRKESWIFSSMKSLYSDLSSVSALFSELNSIFAMLLSDNLRELAHNLCAFNLET